MGMVESFRRVPDDALRDLLAAPDAVFDFLEREGFADLDLDKAWHGLHFLFTGTAWEGAAPLDFLVRGGSQVGERDVGYGPARVFLSAEVREIWTALAPLTREKLALAYDPAAMTRLDIYPAVWDRGDAEDLEYVLEYFDMLHGFIEGAVKEDEGLLVCVS